jgi:hypothetical protein
MAAELDLIAPSMAPAVDTALDRMYQRMVELAEAGDVAGLGQGIAGINHLQDRLDFVRKEAGRFTHDLLPELRYKYRGELRTRKDQWLAEDGSMLIEPALSGGGWRRFDYKAVIKAVMERSAFGLSARVVNGEGEIVGTVEDVVDLLCTIVSFSGVKCDAEKGTGLAAFGYDRSDFGEWDAARKDVKVQTTKGDT